MATSAPVALALKKIAGVFSGVGWKLRGALSPLLDVARQLIAA
jgi:hypothetical protein